TTIAVVSVVYTIGHVFYGYGWKDLYNPVKLNLIYGYLINLGLHLINAIFVYFDEYKRKWVEAEKFKRITAQAQVQLMCSQIKPHFLFNNLNVLASMVVKNNPEANEFIEAFAKVYRYILSNIEKEVIELEKELEFINPYIFLLQKRFDQGLQIDIDVSEDYRHHYIIPAALQMLIENAIKHNTMSASQPLCVTIHANGNETLTVKNNRQPRVIHEVSHKIGLQNIRQRYELVSGRKVEVQQTANYFEVVLPLLHINSVA
ncbi:MAG TPA: histidine kinase, partial [Chitinophagaceae bacterium]|nr:histidine kinase [Chitinophagaceae bacterium]